MENDIPPIETQAIVATKVDDEAGSAEHIAFSSTLPQSAGRLEKGQARRPGPPRVERRAPRRLARRADALARNCMARTISSYRPNLKLLEPSKRCRVQVEWGGFGGLASIIMSKKAVPAPALSVPQLVPYVQSWQVVDSSLSPRQTRGSSARAILSSGVRVLPIGGVLSLTA